MLSKSDIDDMKCPACDKPLAHDKNLNGLWMVWCSRGECKSEAANKGAQGHSILECVTMIRLNYDKEVS